MAKGSMQDVVFILPIAAIVLAIGILIASTVLTNIKAGTTDTLSSAEAQHALDMGQAAVNNFNYVFMMIFFGLGISGLIYAYLVPTNPILILGAVVMLVAGMVMIPIISNTYGTIASQDGLSTAASNFPLITSVMNNLPLVIAVFGFLMIIVLFMRYNSGAGTI